MLRQITKPTPWRGRASLFRTLEEDTGHDGRINVIFKEGHDHWQVGPKVQVQEKARENQELRKKVLAPFRVCAGRTAAASYKSTSVVVKYSSCNILFFSHS